MPDRLDADSIRQNGGEAACRPLLLRAGCIEATFAGGALRNIRAGGVVVLQHVYVAVRDHNWNTIPFTVINLTVNSSEDSFIVEFGARPVPGPIQFAWRGRITGTADSRIRFEMRGTAMTDFDRNRIGICCLHPPELAGRPCELTHSGGGREISRFPETVSPHQPFFDLRAIRHPIGRGEAVVAFEGDVFETEDQRNWTDASFKTYCPPLDLPFPVRMQTGDRIEQAVLVEFKPGPAFVSPSAPDAGPIRMRLSPGSRPLPRLGLGLGHDEPEAEAVFAAAKPAFARMEVDCGRPDGPELLEAAMTKAAQIAIPVRLSLRLPPDMTAGELSCLLEPLSQWETPSALVTLIPPPRSLRDRGWLEEAISAFPKSVRVGAGCDTNFAELNRNRPDPRLLDHLLFAANPQVHLFDNQSIAENLPGIAAALGSALAIAGGKSVHLGPVTLKPVHNPAATRAEEDAPGELPRDVDPRQMSLFAAAWLAGAIGEAAVGGAAEASFFIRATGWRGIREASVGSPLPEAFPSAPGQCFPVFHVLKYLSAHAGAGLQALVPDRDHGARGYRLDGPGGAALVLFNLSGEPAEILVDDPALSGKYDVSRLDADRYAAAAIDVNWLENAKADMALPGRLFLPPYGLLFARAAGK